jgi:hypothetical protein
MSISGHKTVSTFQRYNIIDTADKKIAMWKIEQAAKMASENAAKTENGTRTVQVSASAGASGSVTR